MSWKPNWELPPAPCAHPETCGPQQPSCLPCIAGKNLYQTEMGGELEDVGWENLQEWQREAWRREASDQEDQQAPELQVG